MNLNSKVVWKDSVDLGLSVVVRDREGFEIGVLGSGPADVEARLEGLKVLSIAAVSADGEAFVDLIRSGDIR